jgi:hypothetical protein
MIRSNQLFFDFAIEAVPRLGSSGDKQRAAVDVGMVEMSNVPGARLVDDLLLVVADQGRAEGN